MKINFKEFFWYFLSMFLIVTLSNVFVDAFGGGDPYRLLKLEPYLYVIFFITILVGAYLTYYISKKTSEHIEE